MKEYTENKHWLQDLQVKIFKLYIFLLPISMINLFASLKNVVPGPLANTSSFILHLMGSLLLLIYIITSKKVIMNSLYKYLTIFVFILNLDSILLAILLHEKLGVLHGEDTYIAISGMVLYYFHILTVIYYNYFMFKFIKPKEIINIFKKIVIYILIIGYMQILIINNFPLVSNIYNILNIFEVLRSSEWIHTQDRITLTGSEPAAAGNILGILVIPFILSQIIMGNEKKKNTLLILFYLPIIYFTRSSTSYLLISVGFLIFVIYFFKKFNVKKLLVIVSISIIVAISLLYGINSVEKQGNESFMEDMSYLIIGKITDENNLSTAHRTSTVINDIKVFLKYPIFGIGNGNQGYYYNENLPSWAFASPESMEIYNGYHGIVNGGSFLPAFISGYGLLGTVLLIMFIIKCMTILKKNKAKLENFYYMYVIGGISFLTSACMSTDIVGNYLALFIISIPFIYSKESKVNKTLN